MKAKKIIALLAAATLAMSSMVVSADTIDGTMNYVDTTIYRVTLPTTAGMSFTLDPQGLLSLKDGAVTPSEEGKIVCTTPMVAKNESSVEVVLSADFYVTDTAEADEKATLIASGSTVDDSEKEMQLTITSDTDDDNNGGTTIYVTSDQAGQAKKYTMDAATYTFGGSQETGYTYDLTKDSGSEVEFEIGGTIAKNADWSSHAGADGAKISLNAVFKFYQADDGTTEVENTAPEAPTVDNYVMTANAGDGSVSYTFVNAPTGTLKTCKIDGVAKTQPVSNGYISYSNGVLTIDKARADLFFTTQKSYTITATIGNVDYNLTYTKN